MNGDAKKYNNIKLSFSVGKGIISFLLLFFYLYSGLSLQTEIFIRNYFSSSYLVLLVYVLLLSLFFTIIFIPVSYYTGYYLEHKYNLSNQTFLKWIIENIKESLVGAVIGIPLLLVFYFILNYFLENWWLPFSILIFFVSVILTQILPVLILPIFYKVKPVDNEELKSRILDLSRKAGLKVDNVYKFDMSRNTKKANAAFTGLGRTKRILLADTLLDNYTPDEIETVIAHELGHYKKKHIIKNIIVSTAVSFITFYLIGLIYSGTIRFFGFHSITQIAALPLLLLLGTLTGLFFTPLSNYISRRFEYEADDYAVRTTGKKEAFINTLRKLTDQNLGDRDPHPLVEWFFYSHPSITRRINAINQ